VNSAGSIKHHTTFTPVKLHTNVWIPPCIEWKLHWILLYQQDNQNCIP